MVGEGLHRFGQCFGEGMVRKRARSRRQLSRETSRMVGAAASCGEAQRGQWSAAAAVLSPAALLAAAVGSSGPLAVIDSSA